MNEAQPLYAKVKEHILEAKEQLLANLLGMETSKSIINTKQRKIKTTCQA